MEYQVTLPPFDSLIPAALLLMSKVLIVLSSHCPNLSKSCDNIAVRHLCNTAAQVPMSILLTVQRSQNFGCTDNWKKILRIFQNSRTVRFYYQNFQLGLI